MDIYDHLRKFASEGGSGELSKRKKKRYKLPIEMMNFDSKEARDVTNMPYRPTAEAFLRDSKGNIVAKHMLKDDGTSFLKMPGGGVDPGEDPKTGLLREIMEETGITPKDLKLEKRVKWDWPESWPMFDKQKKRYAQFRGEDSHIFTGDVGDIVAPTSEEGDEWDEIPSMSPKEVLDTYSQNLNPKSKGYQGAAYDPYKKAQLAAVKALLKRKKLEKSAADNHSKIIQFVKDNPKLDDDKFHEFAESIGMDPHDAEEVIYDFVNKNAADKIPGGLADDKKPSDFDPEQLAKGIKVEREHTSDPDIAREIAMDHIEEDPKYYDKLETIEKHAMGPATAALVKAARPGIKLGKEHEDIEPEEIGINGWKNKLAAEEERHVFDTRPSELKRTLKNMGIGLGAGLGTYGLASMESPKGGAFIEDKTFRKKVALLAATSSYLLANAVNRPEHEKKANENMLGGRQANRVNADLHLRDKDPYKRIPTGLGGRDVAGFDAKKKENEKDKATSAKKKHDVIKGKYTNMGAAGIDKMGSIPGLASILGGAGGAGAGLIGNFIASKLAGYDGNWKNYLAAGLGGAATGGAGGYGIAKYYEKNPERFAELMENLQDSDLAKGFEKWQRGGFGSSLYKPVKKAVGRVMTNVKNTGSYDPNEIVANVKKKGAWDTIANILQDKPIYDTRLHGYPTEADAYLAEKLNRAQYGLDPRGGLFKNVYGKTKFKTKEDINKLVEQVGDDPRQLRLSSHPDAKKIWESIAREAKMPEDKRHHPVIGSFINRDGKIKDPYDLYTEIDVAKQRKYSKNQGDIERRISNAGRNLFSRLFTDPSTMNVDLTRKWDEQGS